MALFQFEHAAPRRLHWGILLCVLGLCGLGIVAIASSESSAERHAERQAIWVALGIVCFVLTVALEPKWIRILTPFAYFLLLAALAALLAHGKTVKGATSWFAVGPVRVQPSEFMKILVVLLLAETAARFPGVWRTLPGLALPLAITALPVAIIFIQPDLGTAAVFLPVLFVMLWLGGARLSHLALLGMLAVVGGGFVFTQLRPYQRQRIMTFLHPSEDVQGSDWNIHQAEITLGSGQLWGRAFSGDEEEDAESIESMLGATRMQLDFLPEPHTDFIFASLGSHLGFVGCISVIGLYLLFSIFALHVALTAPNMQWSLAVLGLTTIILTHVVLNIGMSLRLLPVTGLPLPFLSYGGSNMITNFLIAGLIANVAARRNVQPGLPPRQGRDQTISTRD